MGDDIEILISCDFDIDGEDWHDDWSTEDYRSRGFREEKNYRIVLRDVYREVVDVSGCKKRICCGWRIGGSIGLNRTYKKSMLIYQSFNESHVSFYENGTYEYICEKRGKKYYEYNFNEDGTIKEY